MRCLHGVILHISCDCRSRCGLPPHQQMAGQSRQRQQNYNIRTEKSSSSRHSSKTNQLSMFQSKVKVQRPISPKICRNEFDKSSKTMKYRLNMKYPK